jgi:hypothetical protein
MALDVEGIADDGVCEKKLLGVTPDDLFKMVR